LNGIFRGLLVLAGFGKSAPMCREVAGPDAQGTKHQEERRGGWGGAGSSQRAGEGTRAHPGPGKETRPEGRKLVNGLIVVSRSGGGRTTRSLNGSFS